MNSKIPFEELKIYKLISNNFKCVFDVGCREDIDYYKIKPDCEYHLFEPYAPAIKILRNKISKLENSNIIINEFGLSDKSHEKHIYYANVQSFKKHWYEPSKDTGERYDLKTLDEYVKSTNILFIDFIKIDVEGLDYSVLSGGVKTILDNDIVSFIQIEYSGGIKQYMEFLNNFNLYLMMEPTLLLAINKLNNTTIDFKNSLIKITDEITHFIDEKVSKTGAGGNIFGINKNIDSEKLIKDKNLIFKL